MTKFTLSAAGDFLFYFVAAFFLSLILFNYFLYFPLNLVAAGCFSLLVLIICAKIKSLRSEKSNLSAAERKSYEDFILCLNLFSEEKILSLAARVAKKRGFIAKRKLGGLHFEEQKLFAFFRFGFCELEKSDIVKIYRKTGRNARALIVAENPKEEIKNFALRLNRNLLVTNGEEFFKAAKEENLLPESELFISPEKRKKVDFRLLADKKRAKSYLAFGSVFVILSYFAPIKIYYLISGGIMLTLSLLVKIAGRKSAN